MSSLLKTGVTLKRKQVFLTFFFFNLSPGSSGSGSTSREIEKKKRQMWVPFSLLSILFVYGFLYYPYTYPSLERATEVLSCQLYCLYSQGPREGAKDISLGCPREVGLTTCVPSGKSFGCKNMVHSPQVLPATSQGRSWKND